MQYCNGHLSVGRLLLAVPQGSVRGPLLFLLYTAELFDVVSDCGLEGHSYADDTRAYISVPATDAASAVQQFGRCFRRIESWMGSNRLKLNADKTQVIWVGTRQQLDKIHITELQLQSANVQFADTVSDLGVWLTANWICLLTWLLSLAHSCRWNLVWPVQEASAKT